MAQYGVVKRSTGVVEEHDHAGRAERGDGRGHIDGGLAVDGGIEADASAPGKLVVRPGDTDNSASAKFRYLTDKLPDGTGGSGDDDSVARARAGDIQQADVSREARHPEPRQ